MVEMQIGTVTMKNSMEASQNIKKNYHKIQQFYFWVYTKKNLKRTLRR